MQYSLQKIVNISNLIGTSWKHRHSMPFSAVPPAVKGDTGGSILPNNGLLQSNQTADGYKYCPSCFKSVFFTRTERGMECVLRGSKLHFDIKSP